MRRSLVALALTAAWAATYPASGQDMPGDGSCIDCHLQLPEARLVEPARTFRTDIHAAAGLGCLACHGTIAAGDARGTRDPRMGFIAVPVPEQIPELCGSCHSDIQYMKQYDPSLRVDQLAEYRTSGHGQALAAGDTDVATCASCHPPHRIRPPDDPESSVYPTRIADLCGSCHADRSLMSEHGLPNDQFEDYRLSVHGRQMIEAEDVSAPTCNDCHGNHGASPPQVASVERVCGHCHTMVAEQFEAGGHDTAFADEGLPGCATCHGNHRILAPSDADLLARREDVCVRCHVGTDTAGMAFTRMAGWIDSLQEARAGAEAVLRRAENLGMEVSQARFELEEVTTALTKARAAVHAFTLEPVRTELEAGLAVIRTSVERGEYALQDHRTRRLGLAASTGIILMLIGALILKIRQLERSGRAAPPEANLARGRPHD